MFSLVLSALCLVFATKSEDDGSLIVPYRLYYWPITGRGHYIRLLFEDTDTPYVEINDGDEIARMTYCKGQNENQDWPVFAPPMIQHGTVILGQTNTIIRYVAKNVGLLPKDEINQYKADMLMANIQDVNADFAKHNEDTMEDKLAYLNDRFQLWISTFSNGLGKNRFYFEKRCTYADLIVYNMLSVFKRKLGDRYNEFIGDRYPNLEALRKRVDKRDGVQRLKEKNITPYGDPWVLEGKEEV